MVSEATYQELITLARICASNSRDASNNEVARELWKMASEYRDRAMKMDSGIPIDIGPAPELT
jgi:hypothetical protein